MPPKKKTSAASTTVPTTSPLNNKGISLITDCSPAHVFAYDKKASNFEFEFSGKWKTPKKGHLLGDGTHMIVCADVLDSIEKNSRIPVGRARIANYFVFKGDQQQHTCAVLRQQAVDHQNTDGAETIHVLTPKHISAETISSCLEWEHPSFEVTQYCGADASTYDHVGGLFVVAGDFAEAASTLPGTVFSAIGTVDSVPQVAPLLFVIGVREESEGNSKSALAVSIPRILEIVEGLTLNKSQRKVVKSVGWKAVVLDAGHHKACGLSATKCSIGGAGCIFENILLQGLLALKGIDRDFLTFLHTECPTTALIADATLLRGAFSEAAPCGHKDDECWVVEAERTTEVSGVGLYSIVARALKAFKSSTLWNIDVDKRTFYSDSNFPMDLAGFPIGTDDTMNTHACHHPYLCERNESCKGRSEQAPTHCCIRPSHLVLQPPIFNDLCTVLNQLGSRQVAVAVRPCGAAAGSEIPAPLVRAATRAKQ